jgi:hypothetical protein
MIARLLRVDVETLPTIPASVDGLSLSKEYVSIHSTAVVDVEFEYVAFSEQGPTLRLTYGEYEPGDFLRERYMPDSWAFDTRPIARTRHGRPIRISRSTMHSPGRPSQSLTFDVRFQDEHFGYVVTRGKPGTLTPHEVMLAEQLIDAIHLHSHQANPLVINASMSCAANVAFFDDEYRLLVSMRDGAETDMRKAIDNGTREADLQILSEVQQAMLRLAKQRPKACP